MPIPQLRDSKFHIRKIGERLVKRTREGQGKKPLFKRILSHWLQILVVFFLVIVIGMIGLFTWVSRDLPDPNKIIDRTVAESTKIYANDGKTILYEIHGPEKRTIIQLENIPAYMKDATIAVEDKDFFKHGGFDIPAIGMALCHEAFGNLGGLCPPRGGSTITQQFVKNAILTSEHSYTRKIKEIILSYQLEKKFSKDQILQLYLNEIPYGSTAYGVEAASQTFLGKSAKDLTLSESAFLAALPQLPTYYSPFGTHTDELSNRLHLILDLMVTQGYITRDQADEAKKDNILERLKPPSESLLAPHFVMYVRELLSEKYGETVLEQGGLKVTTTLNIDKQRIAEEVVTKYADKNATNYKASNAALVSLDTKTGQILAMVGSKDYNDESIDGNVNVVLRPRQPGSSFKPIVYLTAFQKGYTADTILFDLVTRFKTDTKDYTPKNYDLKEHGPVTMRQALAGSLNIPAVKTLYLAGIDTVIDTAEKLGYSTFSDRSRFGLSLVLGGGEVTLLDHTSAYATFAREGIRNPVTAILKVEDKNGKILEEYKNHEERVIDEKPVRLLNNILSDNGARAYIFGAANHLTLPDRPVAAKTGTTNDYHDAWTIGYTPSIATGVWVGNNNNSEMTRGADGSVVAAPIWQEYMKRTVGGPAEPFKQPDANNSEKPILRGNYGEGVTVKIDKTTGKTIPDSCLSTYPAEFIQEKTLKIAHDILFYVDKDNPQGPVPDDPAKDPQFANWEEPVQKWAKENGYIDTKPPQGDCSLRAKENFPAVEFIQPANGATINTPTFTIDSAPAPKTGHYVNKVEYYLDGNLIKTLTKVPFTVHYTATGLQNGFHDLEVKVYDEVGNHGSSKITFNYLVPEAAQ
ncbi:MAG: PBP1A family penicillin-binding protein [Patescibacteria group bacterium]|jgi:1A family penicillin-binding protein